MACAGTTVTRLLAIVGLAFVAACGHAFVRTAWMDQHPIVLTRQARPPATTPAPGPEGTAPDPDPDADPVPDSAPSVAEAPAPDAAASPLDAPVKPGSITLREALALFEAGAFFLDARYEADYLAGHVEGAFWMPASRVATPDGLAELQIVEPGGTVVIYCTGGDCDASENTAIRIENAGFDFDVRILGKGYEDWANAGLPTATGRDG